MPTGETLPLILELPDRRQELQVTWNDALLLIYEGELGLLQYRRQEKV